jgi:hypothetical protein
LEEDEDTAAVLNMMEKEEIHKPMMVEDSIASSQAEKVTMHRRLPDTYMR